MGSIGLKQRILGRTELQKGLGTPGETRLLCLDQKHLCLVYNGGRAEMPSCLENRGWDQFLQQLYHFYALANVPCVRDEWHNTFLPMDPNTN